MNDKPLRSMVQTIPRHNQTSMPLSSSSRMKQNMDADLGNIHMQRPIRPPSSQPKQQTQSQSTSNYSAKGYIRGPPKTTTATTTKTKTANQGPVKVAQMMYPENTDTSDVGFPVDMVYTWVDGSDPEWQNIRRKFQLTQKNIPQDSLLDCRWRDFDELRLSIESVNRFAPWIRTIYVITDFQRPYWYDESNPGKVKFIDHQILFKDFEEHLPTFNSHAIECHLHRIEGLSEHFIYSNDDTFFGNDVYPLDFFTPDGNFKVFLTITDMETEKTLKERATTTPQNPVLSMSNPKVNPKMIHVDKSPPIEQLDILPYFTAQAVTNNVLDGVFNPPIVPRKRLKHQMKAFRKSTYEWCWENEFIQLYLFNTSSTRFRSLGDIDSTSLVSHVGLLLGVAIPASISSKYYGITDNLDITKLFYHLYKFRPTPKLYCLNDSLVNPPAETLQTIRKGMEKYLPHKYNIKK